jgi:hypothetical protein
MLPQIPCKRKACKTCQKHGNKKVCFGNQPLKFTIDHTFVGAKNANAHARIKICKKIAFLF